MKTLKAFVREHRIRAKAEWADRNPSAPDWKDANHFKVTLRRDVLVPLSGHTSRQLTTYFSQGYGIQGEPTAVGVLSCLISDAASYNNARGFEDWASDLGFDPDSRKAERTYRAVEKQVQVLKRFLGDELYREALTETEPE